MMLSSSRILLRRSVAPVGCRLSFAHRASLLSTSVQDAVPESASGCSESSASSLRQIFFEKGASAARYSYFAERADEEGATKAASLFRALSSSDRRHAHQALDAIDCYVGQDPTTSETMGDSVDNMHAALVSEMHDFEKTLPEFAQKAQDDNDQDIADLLHGFSMAAQNRIADIKALVHEMDQNNKDEE